MIGFNRFLMLGVSPTEIGVVFYSILLLVLLYRYPELVFAGVQLLIKLTLGVAVAIGLLFIYALIGDGDE